MFKLNELAVVNDNSRIGTPNHAGDLVEIIETERTALYDYRVKFLDSGDTVPLKQKELSKIDPKDEILLFNVGDKVMTNSINEECIVTKIDYLHRQLEVEFSDGARRVKGVKNISKIKNGKRLTLLGMSSPSDRTDKMNEFDVVYSNRVADIFLSEYKNDDDTYTLPASIVDKLLDLNRRDSL
ncbi:YorP family protein [Lederbergia lenta]|uniref:YorP family protein n=1 Tax=Lederbergia lenta TaxID=1467 RepID=UPI00203F7C03|nr:YorP family protein [Lederbergia lenta]MCM3109883.1 YorP family protein [Lederbergia lenta]